MFPRKSEIQDLPWDEIRRRYETEGMTIADLQRHYHVASRTTLTRRRDREGWVVSVADTATGMRPIVAAMAEMAEPDPDEDALPEWGGELAPEPVPEPVQEPAPEPAKPRRRRRAASHAEPSPLMPRLAPDPPRPAAPPPEIASEPAIEPDRVLEPTEEELSEAMEQRAMTLVNKLTRVQASRIHKQLGIADEVQQVGLRILRTISRMFEPSNGDPELEAEVQQAVVRLIRVNADRETLAGLVKAASDVVHKGITIERVALGMDIPARQLGGPVPEMPPSVTDKPAIGLIQKLDYDTAKKLRDLAVEMKREQDRRRTGQAA